MCLKRRVEGICKGNNLRKELQHLTATFTANGYPKGLIHKVLTKRRRKGVEEHRKEDQRILCLPYVKGLSETITNMSPPQH